MPAGRADRRRWTGARRPAGSRIELAGRNPLLALVHHPLALEWGLSAEQADTLRAANARRWQPRKRVVVTSAATARLVASDYGVPAERIDVARPGSDPVAAAHSGSRTVRVRAAVGRRRGAAQRL